MNTKGFIAATCAVSLGLVAIDHGQHTGESTIVDPRPLAAASREVEAPRRPDRTRMLVPKGCCCGSRCRKTRPTIAVVGSRGSAVDADRLPRQTSSR